MHYRTIDHARVIPFSRTYNYSWTVDKDTHCTLASKHTAAWYLYSRAQANDPTCSLLLQYCSNGWPVKQSVDLMAKLYWSVRGELTAGDNLLLCGGRIVVLEILQGETPRKLHEGHQGIVRCCLRAHISVWWPGLSKQLADLVKRCPECTQKATPNKEPLLPTPLPEYPWQKVASDLFGANHLIVNYYLLQYPEVVQLKTTTLQSIITVMKSFFARHGIPETVTSDNGPQYNSHCK